jgi:hypothetical protein
MTRPNHFDHALEDWLQEGPEVAPRDLLEAVLVSIPPRQHRRPVAAVRRRFLMLALPVRLATGIAAAVVVGVVGISLVNTGSHSAIGGPGPATAPPSPPPSPAGSPSPSPTSRVAGAIQIDRGVLTTGTTYTTPIFEPVFTVVGIDGLELRASEAASVAFWLHGVFHEGSIGIGNPKQVLDVAGNPQPVPADLAAWLEARSDLVLAAPKAVTIGGLPATQLEGTVRQDVPLNTTDADNVACGDSVTACKGGAGLGFGRSDHFRMVVLNVRGATVLIVMDAPATAWDVALPQFDAFLAGLRFPAPSGG